MATAVMPKVHKNYINGEWVESHGGKAFENRNPANQDELIGMFQDSSPEDVNAAVDAAREAYKTWRLVPAPKRAEILFLRYFRVREFNRDANVFWDVCAPLHSSRKRRS